MLHDSNKTFFLGISRNVHSGKKVLHRRYYVTPKVLRYTEGITLHRRYYVTPKVLRYTEGIPPKVFHRRYSTEGIPPKVLHRRYYTEGITPKVFHRRYSTEGIPPKVFHRRYYTEQKRNGPVESLFFQLSRRYHKA